MDTTSTTSVPTQAWTFNGPTAKGLGRFGLVTPGQTLRLTLEEAKDIVSDSEWSYVPDQIREVVDATRTYYVAPSGGSDTADGRTTTTPFATLSKAIDVVHSLDIRANVNVFVQLQDGTHAIAAQINIRNFAGIGQVFIQGNLADKSAVTLTAPAGSNAIALNFIGTGGSRWVLKSLTIVGTTASVGVNLSNFARLTCDSLRFGGNFLNCFSIANGSFLQLIGAAWEFFGAVTAVFLCQRQSQVLWTTTATATITGTPLLGVFVSAIDMGYVRISAAVTFSGSATGNRYGATGISLIQTNGAGASFFPGNAGGTADSTSVYA